MARILLESDLHHWSTVRLWFVIALWVYVPVGLASEASFEVCSRFLQRLRSQSTMVYRPDCCNMNVTRALKQLETWEPDFDPDRAKVLILRPAAERDLFPLVLPKVRWAYHVVLYYEGHILDLDMPGEPMPTRTYFQRMFLQTPQRSSPRKFVDRLVGNPTPWDNLKMTVGEVSVEDYRRHFQHQGFRVAPQAFPAVGIETFLREHSGE